ncbi:MAG: hypothetical protein K0R62_2868 [Nonomuraea muscovyensis]|jgi:hypothetical protein|nr:hypothetical protein [Nonomuraea muscovyensis]
MMFEALTWLSTTSLSPLPSETPSDDQARVPTRTMPSGSWARMTGMIWCA